MENNQAQSTNKNYVDHLKSGAKSGFATGVNVEAIAAPILVVVKLVGLIGKKNWSS